MKIWVLQEASTACPGVRIFFLGLVRLIWRPDKKLEKTQTKDDQKSPDRNREIWMSSSLYDYYYCAIYSNIGWSMVMQTPLPSWIVNFLNYGSELRPLRAIRKQKFWNHKFIGSWQKIMMAVWYVPHPNGNSFLIASRNGLREFLLVEKYEGNFFFIAFVTG